MLSHFEVSEEKKVAIKRLMNEFANTQWLSRTLQDKIQPTGRNIVDSYESASAMYYERKFSFLTTELKNYYALSKKDNNSEIFDAIIRTSNIIFSIEGDYTFDMLIDVECCIRGCLAEIFLEIPMEGSLFFEVWYWLHHGHWACGLTESAIVAIY